MISFNDIYICISVSGSVGRDSSAMCFPGVYDAVELCLFLSINSNTRGATSFSILCSDISTILFVFFVFLFFYLLFAIVVSIMFRFTASDYPFDTYKLIPNLKSRKRK